MRVRCALDSGVENVWKGVDVGWINCLILSGKSHVLALCALAKDIKIFLENAMVENTHSDS